jgi:hypothetical protein
MRHVFSSAIVLALFSLAAPASAQQVTRLPEGSKNAVGIESGFESAFAARGMYTRRLDLGILKDERFFARFTMPMVSPDLRDWSFDAGLQATLLSRGDFRFAVLASPVVRSTKNELFSATAIGIGATALIGYEGSRWGLSAELGHEQLFASHLSHSDVYRDTGYAGAKDGWYTTTGSTTRGGLRAGVRFGELEIAARAGMAATGFFQPAGPPFFFTLGGSYAF